MPILLSNDSALLAVCNTIDPRRRFHTECEAQTATSLIGKVDRSERSKLIIDSMKKCYVRGSS